MSTSNAAVGAGVTPLRVPPIASPRASLPETTYVAAAQAQAVESTLRVIQSTMACQYGVDPSKRGCGVPPNRARSCSRSCMPPRSEPHGSLA